MSTSIHTFFSETVSQTHGDKVFKGYAAKHPRSTMVLFSNETRTPLAALVLTARNSDVTCLFTERPGLKDSAKTFFQGILNQDNQEFNFTIANLSPTGMINFNILRAEHAVREVDPGPMYGVNKINEIRPEQAYTIPSDQQTGRTMILSGLVKTQADGTVQPMLVEEAEQKATPQGVYFHLSVVAQSGCTELVNKFKEGTTWKCVSTFVRQLPKLVSKSPVISSMGERRPEFSGSYGQEHFQFGSPVELQEQFGSLEHVNELHRQLFRGIDVSRGPDQSAAAMGEQERGLQVYDNHEYGQEHNRRRFCCGTEASRFVKHKANQPSPNGVGFSFMNQSHNPDGAAASVGAGDFSFGAAAAPDGAEGFSFGATALGASDAVAPGNSFGADERFSFGAGAGAAVDHSVRKHADIDVGQSQAGTIQYGSEIKVDGQATGVEYEYDYPSNSAVVCMSILKDMKLLDLPDLNVQLGEELKEWVTNHGKALVEALKKVFVAETCVIDLESPADTIIIQCGHQCLNHQNIGGLVNCPVCRGSISGFVRADGLIM